MTKQISGQLQNVRSMLGTVERNIAATQVAGSKALDTSLRIDPLGSGGTYRTSVVTTRRNDPLQTKILFSSITKASQGETEADSLSALQQVVGNSTEPHKSLLVTAVTEFIAQSKILPVNHDLSARRAFIDKGSSLASALNNSTNRVKDLRLNADSDLKNGLATLNNELRSLSVVNQDILGSRVPETLHDKRDRLIQEISRKLDVNVCFGSKGAARLTTKDSSYELVTENGRAVFSYAGVRSDGDFNPEDIPPVTLAIYNNKNELTIPPAVVIGGNNTTAIQALTGGQIGAWVNLRDTALPLAGDALKSLSAGVAKAVNYAHNSGSTYPPKTVLSGSKAVYGQQTLDLHGKVSFCAVDPTGAQLTGGAGRLNEVSIDFSTFKGSGFDGKPTTLDIIKEINQILDTSPSRDRVAIGGILDNNGAQIGGQYLLNNIQLAGVSDISVNGDLTFDLDLQGNSFFGSKVEVLGVTGPGGALGTAMLPPAFRLEKDTNTRTGNPIILGGFVAGAAGTVPVTMQIRVTGDNGVISEGSVTFQVDQNSTKTNQRIAYVAGQAGAAPNGGFVFSPAINSHSGIARAILADDQGNEITDPSSSALGHLVINTNDPSFALSVQGGNLSSYFGLNNFFEFDETTGEINVKSAINNDPRQLATGMVAKTDGVDTVVTVGQNPANASLLFLQNFQAADTITIDGQVFTFGAAVPVNTNQVQIGVDLPTSLQNLINQINNHPILKSKFTAASDGVSSATITTNTPGAWGNALQVSAVLGGGVNTVSINAGAAAANVGPVNFINGTNITQTIKVFDYTIGSASSEVFERMQLLSSTDLEFTGGGNANGEYTSTLQGFATTISGVVTQQYNQAVSDKNVLTESLQALNQATELYAPDLYEQYYYSLELIQFMKAIATFGRMTNDNLIRTDSILFDR